jgi:hypothetical protein
MAKKKNINYCKYHPQEKSIGICYECGCYICAEDKVVYTEKISTNRRSESASGGRMYRTELHDCCLPCHADLIIKESKSHKIMGVVFLIFGVIFIGLSSIIGSPYVLPVIGLILTGFGLYYIITGTQKTKQFKSDKAIFLASLQ